MPLYAFWRIAACCTLRFRQRVCRGNNHRRYSGSFINRSRAPAHMFAGHCLFAASWRISRLAAHPSSYAGREKGVLCVRKLDDVTRKNRRWFAGQRLKNRGRRGRRIGIVITGIICASPAAAPRALPYAAKHTQPTPRACPANLAIYHLLPLPSTRYRLLLPTVNNANDASASCWRVWFDSGGRRAVVLRRAACGWRGGYLALAWLSRACSRRASGRCCQRRPHRVVDYSCLIGFAWRDIGVSWLQNRRRRRRGITRLAAKTVAYQ